jgi:hypothetical protein
MFILRDVGSHAHDLAFVLKVKISSLLMNPVPPFLVRASRVTIPALPFSTHIYQRALIEINMTVYIEL